MLHVGLVILKIIGFVLLGILCLLLGLILLVLLVPVRYRMEGSWKGELRGMARITWLLHMVSVSVSYGGDGEMITSIRLFGFRLFRNREDGEKVLEEGLSDAEEDAKKLVHVAEHQGAREEGRKIVEDPLIRQDDGADTDTDLMLQTQELGGGGSDETSSEPAAEKDGDAELSVEDAIGDRTKDRILEKIKFLFHSLCDKLKHSKEIYEEILTFIKDEKNQETMKLIWKQGKKLVRHILPRKAEGYVAFGFDDPSTTGQVLAAASLFYAWYGQKIELIPMFEEPILEGELKLRGRIRMGTVLWCGLRIFLNKNFRVLLKRWQARSAG